MAVVPCLSPVLPSVWAEASFMSSRFSIVASEVFLGVAVGLGPVYLTCNVASNCISVYCINVLWCDQQNHLRGWRICEEMDSCCLSMEENIVQGIVEMAYCSVIVIVSEWSHRCVDVNSYLVSLSRSITEGRRNENKETEVQALEEQLLEKW